MDNIIEIAITDENDLYEKYNKKYVSSSLINYILEETKNINNNGKIKIIISSTLKESIDYESLIKEGLEKEYKINLRRYNRNKYLKLFYLALGIIFLILSFLLKNTVIFSEILLIGGWVLIWEVIELQIFTDFEDNIKRKILKKLISSLIIENR